MIDHRELLKKFIAGLRDVEGVGADFVYDAYMLEGEFTEDEKSELERLEYENEYEH